MLQLCYILPIFRDFFWLAAPNGTSQPVAGNFRPGYIMMIYADMAAKQCVLVVDDEPGIVEILGIKLKLHGYEVVGATSGAEAVALARERRPDVILLDMLMPGMSGMEVLDKLRAFSSVPVIVFTARPDITELALKMGAAGAIAKPFDPDRLVEKIGSVLASDGKNV
jgi:DNA-binding response OmpR family regulator